MKKIKAKNLKMGFSNTRNGSLGASVPLELDPVHNRLLGFAPGQGLLHLQLGLAVAQVVDTPELAVHHGHADVVPGGLEAESPPQSPGHTHSLNAPPQETRGFAQ